MLGKVFTMAYSVVGIPLALIMFQVERSGLLIFSVMISGPSCRASESG